MKGGRKIATFHIDLLKLTLNDFYFETTSLTYNAEKKELKNNYFFPHFQFDRSTQKRN